MRLAKVDVRALPGLEGRFTLEPGPGVNLVVGPNTSGKSSLVRAVQGLLWPGSGTASARDYLSAAFIARDGERTAERRPDGALAWTRDGMPLPPPRIPDDHLRDRYSLGLGDLVDTRGGGREQAFAAEIRRQVTGGFDLDVAGSSLFRTTPASVRARLREWRQAGHARAEREGLHRELREREKALDTWRADLAAAEARASEAEGVRAALAAQAAESALAAAEARLAQFPPALADFRADDPAALAAARDALAGAEADVAAHSRRLEEALARRRALGDGPRPDAPYPPAVEVLVEAWRQATVALESACVALEGARGLHGNAAARLGGAAAAGDGHGGGPDALALERLAQLFVDAEAARARLRAAESLLAERLLADAAGPGAPGPAQLDDTAAAVAALDAWLALPAPSPWWPLAMGVAGAVLLAGAVLAGGGQPTPLPAVVGAALLVAGLAGAMRAALAQRRRGRQTDRIRRALADAGLAEAERAVASADAATATAVRERLRQAGSRRELVTAWRDRLQAERDLADARLRELEAEAAGLRERWGLGAALDGRAVLHDVDAAARLRGADADLARALAERDKRADNAAERGARVLDAFAAAGEPAPADPVEAAGALRRWQARLDEQAALEAVAERAREDLAAATRRRDEAIADLARRRGRLGLSPTGDDDERIGALAAAHAQWLVAARERDEARAALAARLAGADPALVAQPRERLEERLDRSADAPAVARDLLQRIAKLEADLDGARRNRGLEQALAAQELARDRLAEERSTARRAALADWLLEGLRRQEAASSRPAVLEHAAALLRAFTQGRHRLELAAVAGGPASFVAVDEQTGLRQELSELSDGTRSQLLLAVRLAFITAMEGDEPLPIFLDEALTTTDPARFAAVAGALGELARAQGRQVFYLTSQPGDAAAWDAALAARGLPPARVLDLAAARGAAAAALPAQLPPPPPAPLPEPGEGPAALEAWRLAVRVPPLDPARGAGAQHVAWLLLDDARAEHRLLSSGASRVGPLLAALEDLVDFGAVEAAQAARLRVRARALEAFIAAWQVGRGRPVTAADVDASGVVSEVMRAPLLELLDRLGGDARALSTRWREVARLREKVAEALLDHLRETGALDERDVLDEGAVLARVLGALGREGTAAEAAGPEVAAWVARWWRAAAAAAGDGEGGKPGA